MLSSGFKIKLVLSDCLFPLPFTPAVRVRFFAQFGTATDGCLSVASSPSVSAAAATTAALSAAASSSYVLMTI